MSPTTRAIVIFAAIFVAVAQAEVRSRQISGYIPPNGEDAVATLISHVSRAGPSSFNMTGDKLNVCWKDTITRGVGRPVHDCPAGMEKDAGLCYQPCRDGYEGVGPVCWEECKSSYTDNGAFCGKSGKIISADNDDCPWYDMCGLTLDKGCSKCPAGYHNDGCTCRIDPHTYTKDSYGRGVGKPMGCSDDEDYDAGLCYEKCPKKYEGVGPVCWQECPRARPHELGAMCCTSEEACNDFVKKVSKATVTAVAAAVEAGREEHEVKASIKKLLEVAGNFVLFSCDRFTVGRRR